MQFDFTSRGLFVSQHLRYKRLWLLVGLLMVCIVMLLSVIDVPPPVKYAMAHDKLVHLFVYMALTGWFSQIFRHDLTRLLFVCFFVAMGVGMEFLQGMVPSRQFDVLDMVANSCGVLLAWALSYTWVGELLAQFEGLFYRREVRA
jgi:VanZ family protein